MTREAASWRDRKPWHRKAVLAVSVTAFAAGGSAFAQLTKPTASYLSPAFHLAGIVPPPPQRGDARYEADRVIFRQTRALQGSARWQLAVNDASERSADLLRDFSCAAGVQLTPDNAPRTTDFLERSAIDTARANNEAKNAFKRLRPFLIDDGATCQPKSAVMDSYDYPSGHTTRGWTWATLLARLLPDHAQPILARGRAYGESRIVCGVHNASAVDAGRLSASASLAAMDQSAAFQRDFRRARAELAHLQRRTHQHPLACTAEQLSIPSVYPDPSGT